MGRSTFEGTLEAARGGGAFIPLPAGVLAELGGTRRRVRGSLNGVEFQSSTMPTGGGTACLGVHKATREAAGAEFGDRVTVEVEPDDTPREVEIPPDLASALSAEPDLQAAFDRLSHTNRKEYAEWIAGAKREETRSRRLAETLDRLRGAS